MSFLKFMAVVSITRLRLRSAWYLPKFFYFAFLSKKQATKSKGNITAQVFNDSNRAFWTMTVWQTMEDMKSFLYAGDHCKAMSKLYPWCDEATFVHWTQDSNDLPDWEIAYSRLTREGTISKVKFPSPNHTTKNFPKPRFLHNR